MNLSPPVNLEVGTGSAAGGPPATRTVPGLYSLRVNEVIISPDTYRKPLSTNALELVHVLEGTVYASVEAIQVATKQAFTDRREQLPSRHVGCDGRPFVLTGNP